MRTENEVVGASMSSAFGHSTQPAGLVLLGDALWHRRKVLGVHPSSMIFLNCRDIFVVEFEIVGSAGIVGRVFDEVSVGY